MTSFEEDVKAFQKIRKQQGVEKNAEWASKALGNFFRCERKENSLEEKYLVPNHNMVLKNDYKYENPKVAFGKLIEMSLEPSPCDSEFEIRRKLFDGRIEEVEERTGVSETSDASSSMSVMRKTGDASSYVRGSRDYKPFRPGGWDEDLSDDEEEKGMKGREELKILDQGEYLQTLPRDIRRQLDEEYDDTVVVGKNEESLYDQDFEQRETHEPHEDDKNIIRLDDIFEETTFENLLEDRTKPSPDETSNVKKPSEDDDGEEEEEENFVEDSEEEAIQSDNEDDRKRIKGDDKTEKISSPRPKDDEESPKLKKADSFDDLMNLGTSSPASPQIFNFLSSKGQRHSSPSKKKKKRTTWAIMDRVKNIQRRFPKLVPNMAMKWPFDLDAWQKESVYRIENGQNLFVSAHTSAGKTVCAEYAIALSQKHLTRTIYTSPIKTLSNQKFREFRETFGVKNVGLITGDVQINPTASCLIMTTEILRSMLYRGADIIRDVEWVIFDEVHYVNDRDRGVVWEEVIILLPQHVSIVMLSATIPNTQEFADWVGRTKKKPVFVVSTKKRPVPLEHHIFFQAQMFKIVDRKGTFLPGGYGQAAALRARNREKDKRSRKPGKFNRGGRGGGGRNFGRRKFGSDWDHIVEVLKQKKYLPVVIFTFSRKQCKKFSTGLGERCDLTSKEEKFRINGFFKKCMKTLSPKDRDLPQISQILGCLERGIGMHHSGLLPLVKEIVEILFSRGLCRVLFATETFAMGVNMPAKTVIFNGMRKPDGKQFRSLSCSEYTQMSGRAGRRGIDKVGNVLIHLEDHWDFPNPKSFRELILGKSTMLESKFKLSYNMILNLLRVEDLKVVDMMRRSFSEVHNQKYLNMITDKVLKRERKKILDIEDSMQCSFSSSTRDPIRNELGNLYYYVNEYETVLNSISKFQVFNALGKGGVDLIKGKTIVVCRTQIYGICVGVVVEKRIRRNVNSGASVGLGSRLTRNNYTGNTSHFMVLVLAPPVFVKNEEDVGGVKRISGKRPYNEFVSATPSGYLKFDRSMHYASEVPEFRLVKVELIDLITICKEKIDFDKLDPLAQKRPSSNFNISVTTKGKKKKKKKKKKKGGGGGGGFHQRRDTDTEARVSTYQDLTEKEKLLMMRKLRDHVWAKKKHLKAYRLKDTPKLNELNYYELFSDKKKFLRIFQKNEDKGDEEEEDEEDEEDEEEPEEKGNLEEKGKNENTNFSSCLRCPLRFKHLRAYRQKFVLDENLKRIEQALSDDNLSLKPKFEKMLGVLAELHYVSATKKIGKKKKDEEEEEEEDEKDEKEEEGKKKKLMLHSNYLVELKGRVASEVNVCNSLIVTEMIFEGVFNGLEIEEIAALLSCLVCSDRTSDEDLNLNERLKYLKAGLENLSEKIGSVQILHGILMNPREFVRRNVRGGLMEVAYRWCRGEEFSTIMAITEIQEGIIVRNIIQIAQCAREIRDAARVIGDRHLMKNMEETQSRIKRDIVFSASLYLQ